MTDEQRIKTLEQALVEVAGILKVTVGFRGLRERGATALADVIDRYIAEQKQEQRPEHAPEQRTAA